ncbi:hypothetical protein Tco_0318965 [Tanacetum coccineum]
MFHVSNLKKCLVDPTLQVPLDEIRVDAKLNFVEEPVEILEREFKKLKRSRIAIVKILYCVDGGDFVENYGDLWFIVINNPFWKYLEDFGLSLDYGPLCRLLVNLRDFGFDCDLGHHSRLFEVDGLQEDLLDDEEKGDKDGDANDEGDDHISDTQDADDEDAETEYDVDEISKPDVENSEEEEECFSSGFGTQFFNSSSDISLTGVLKDTAEADLRVAKLKKDVSELKKIDLSAEALAALKIQVPSIIDILDPKIGISLDRGENAMDKGVTDTIKDHKRKHDDDDDEDPLSSKTNKFDSAKEPVEEPTAEVVMDDAGEDVVRDDDQLQDTFEPKTTKTPNPEWFMQPPRPPTPDSKWNKHQVVFDQPEQPWFNQMVFTTKDPLTFNDLMATSIDFSNCVELEYHFQECFNALTDKLDWNNPEGDRYPFDLSKPLPLQEKTYTTSITKTKAARYEIEGIEDMVPMLWSPTKVGYDKDALKGIKHWGKRRKLWHRSHLNKFSRHNVYSTKKIIGVKSVSVKKLHGYGHLEEIVVKRADCQLYKFKEGDMSRRKWTTIEKKRSKLMVELIDKQMLERRIIQNLERLVGARELEMDYKLMARTI